MDNTGACICAQGFSGPSCSNKVVTYSGKCDSKCAGGCSGPTAYECIGCVPNSTPNKYGACVCDRNWMGDDCSISS